MKVSSGKIELSVEQIRLIKDILKKNNVPNPMRFFSENGDENNNFERLERASFFLEQEKAELEEILLSYSNAKDEINEFLSKRVNNHNFLKQYISILL